MFTQQKTKKSFLFKKSLSFLVIFQLIFYQMFWIFPNITKADEVLGEQVEENIPEVENSTEEDNENGDGEENNNNNEEKILEKNADVEENQDEDCGPSDCPETEIEDNNQAEIINNVETEAESGENKINEQNNDSCSEDGENTEGEEDNQENCQESEEGSEGSQETDENESAGETQKQEEALAETEVETEEAASQSQIYNNVNFNATVTGGDGEVENLNINGEFQGSLDINGEFENIISDTDEEFEGKESQETEVENDNQAQVENNVETRAITGENEIEGGDGGNIETGDALAISQVINFVNTNLTGSEWLFFSVNVLGEWSGDILVPGSSLLKVYNLFYSDLKVENNNQAQVENNVETRAITGENEIEGGDGGNIETGQALAVSDVSNVVNTNITANNWFMLMINNLEKWSGQVIDPSGTFISKQGTYQYDFNTQEKEKDLGSLKVENNNQAQVENDVETQAITGENEIDSGEQGSSNIETGDAWSISQVLNVVNTNITGNNWLFGMINILGSWSGNLIFSYPDLAVSLSDGKEKDFWGEENTYVLSYANLGNAKAENVEISVELPKEFNYISDTSSFDESKEGNKLTWKVGNLEYGESGNFQIQGKWEKAGIYNEKKVKADSLIGTETTEPSSQNNFSSDITTLIQYSNSKVEYSYKDEDEEKKDSKIVLTRSSQNSSTARPGESMKNSITIENKGETSLYQIIVQDKLFDGNDVNLGSYVWNISDMKKGEKIRIDYEIALGNPGHTMTFTSEAQAYGYDSYDRKVKSQKATGFLTVLGFLNQAVQETIGPAETAQAGEVEGASTPLEKILSLPFWIWIMALVAYTLALNWSLFPKLKEFKIKKIRW